MAKLNDYLTPVRDGIFVGGELETAIIFPPFPGKEEYLLLDFVYPKFQPNSRALFSIIEGKIQRFYALVKISDYYGTGGSIEGIELHLSPHSEGKILSHLDAFKKELDGDFWRNERESVFYKEMTERVESTIKERSGFPAIDTPKHSTPGKVLPFRKKEK